MSCIGIKSRVDPNPTSNFSLEKITIPTYFDQSVQTWSLVAFLMAFCQRAWPSLDTAVNQSFGPSLDSVLKWEPYIYAFGPFKVRWIFESMTRYQEQVVFSSLKILSFEKLCHSILLGQNGKTILPRSLCILPFEVYKPETITPKYGKCRRTSLLKDIKLFVLI
jgi:hypothetical protein